MRECVGKMFCATDHLSTDDGGAAFRGSREIVTTPQRVEADLGWALGTVMRAYLRTAQAMVGGLPGGPRGYQVLAAAAAGARAPSSRSPSSSASTAP